MLTIISCADFYAELKEQGINFFAGVPDSLLKDFCAFLDRQESPQRHIIAANEGNALALAAGYHLATKGIGLVYMQNSGLGNTVNPLLSLADPLVYSIPVLLLIGWRGQPGTKDEPQHAKQGQVTPALLEAMHIKYAVLPENMGEARQTLKDTLEYVREKSAPATLVVPVHTFAKYPPADETGEEEDGESKVSAAGEEIGKELEDNATGYTLTREKALQVLLEKMQPADVVVSTTGKISREIFEYRAENRQGHHRDFLTVGSMGHSSQIALGIALAKPRRNVYCIDGDGSLLMHMGALAINGTTKPPNFKHVILNNGAHESVGGQPTAGFKIDIPGVAQACGYKQVFSAETAEEIINAMEDFEVKEGPVLLEIRVKKGARSNLGRPTTSPLENKQHFMNFLSSS